MESKQYENMDPVDLINEIIKYKERAIDYDSVMEIINAIVPIVDKIKAERGFLKVIAIAKLALQIVKIIDKHTMKNK
jgi:hypothetical protein